jgi:5-methyltetrahydropteroyltriglutamate--homocysteine methyltransferase
MKSQDRAEHVGSLLRPQELLQARASFAEGRLGQEQLREIEDRAILDVLEKQSAAGLDRITDGEFRRGSWLTDMADAVEGFVRDRVVLDWKGPGGGPEVSSANAVGAKLRKTRRLTEHEVPFLLKSSKGPFKVTLPAPSNFVVCSYRPGITEKIYATRAEL